MPLNLKVPILQDQPQQQAETDPLAITQLLENLPVPETLQAATVLLRHMEILNRQKMTPDIRVKALEAYRPTLDSLSSALAAEYCSALLPLPETAKKYAALAQSLWQELGYGYKLAILDQQARLFSLSGSKSTASMVLQAIEALGQLAMVYYETYFVPPASFWSDVHQLYLFAVQNDLQDTVISGDGSVSLAYKRVLLMSLADPQHLPVPDMQEIAAYIARHAGHAELQGLAPLKNLAGIFLVRLDSDQPPLPYYKNSRQTDAGSDILLITVELARRAYQHLLLLQSGNAHAGDELPEHAGEPRYQDMLSYLIKQWGSPPKRIFNRLRDNDSVELAIGIKAAHHFASGNNSNASTHPVYPVVPWQALNISAGGMALRQYPNTQSSMQIGALLTVRNRRAAPQWAIGVLRWASNNEHLLLDIGVQLIAPEAKPADVRTTEQGDWQLVLLLSAMAALKQEASIIAATGTYGLNRVLELNDAGKISRISIKRLIERTGSFERFEYSPLN